MRSVAGGKVEIGAFRTFPEGYKPPEDAENYVQTSVPLKKVEDYQKTHKSYYKLEVEFFKSTTDANILNLLWNKYWINTLSASPLLAVCTNDANYLTFNIES